MRRGTSGPSGRGARAVGRRVTTRLLGVLALAVTWGSDALAEPQPSPSPAPAAFAMRLRERGPTGPWTLKATNTSPSALRLPPLHTLGLELKQGSSKPTSCKFPGRTRKTRLGEALEPGAAFELNFDPRWYCFDANKSPLAPGASVRVVWGKRAVTEWHTLGPEYALWSSAKKSKGVSNVRVRVSGSDAEDARSATLKLSVSNGQNRSVRVLLRHEALAVDVAGPEGTVSCPAQWSDGEQEGGESDALPWWERAGAEEENRGSVVRAGKRLSATVRVFELCPRGTLTTPGLYRVDVRLPLLADDDEDADDGGGQAGKLLAPRRPALIRVRNPLALPLARRRDVPAGATAEPTAQRPPPRPAERRPERPAPTVLE